MCSHVFFVIKIYLLYIGVCVALWLVLHACFYKNNKACNVPIPIQMRLFKGQKWYEEWEERQSSVHICTQQQQSYVLKPSGTRLSSRKNNICSYDIPSCRPQYRQTSFFPRTIPDWNRLPQEVVTAESLDCFKSRLNSLL